VRIGTQLAALNGYTAEQSVGLYPTTGDSIDWLYGYLSIFGILFEVGREFHPSTAQEALGVISENIPPIMLGIEIAGDRYQEQFTITHAPSGSREYSSAGFELQADVVADRGVDDSQLRVFYRVDSGTWSSAAMAHTAANDTYSGIIPSQPVGSSVEYYIVAHDKGGVELMSPMYAPYEVHSFLVIDTAPPVAQAEGPSSALLGESVVLNGSGSMDNYGIASCKWTFRYNGSDVVLSGEEVSFTFWVPGTYEVTLNVTDASGNYDTDVIYVTVQNSYIPEFGTSALITALLLLGLLLCVHRSRRR
jgi:hypothetical protein